MITVSMTPNLLGFNVRGTYDDLYALYDAIGELHYDECPMPGEPIGTLDEILMSTRLLALNYDLRHAYQGDRNIHKVEEPIPFACMDLDEDDEDAGEEGPAHTTGFEYSVEILFPELVYEMLALNYLIDARKARLRKSRDGMASLAFIDYPIAVVRCFQAQVLKAIEARTTSNSFTRIRRQIEGNYLAIPHMYTQWVTLLDERWSSYAPDKRQKSLSTMTRDVAEFNHVDEYRDMRAEIDRFMREDPDVRNRDEVELYTDFDWDEEIPW